MTFNKHMKLYLQER